MYYILNLNGITIDIVNELGNGIMYYILNLNGITIKGRWNM